MLTFRKGDDRGIGEVSRVGIEATIVGNVMWLAELTTLDVGVVIVLRCVLLGAKVLFGCGADVAAR